MDINIHSKLICKAQDLGTNYVYTLSLVIWALYVMHTSWRLGVSSLGLKSESGMIFLGFLLHMLVDTWMVGRTHAQRMIYASCLFILC